MFLSTTFTSSVQLNPSELQINFEKVIKDKLKSKYEGICSRYGYIKPNSIEILKRSAGVLSKQHFNGNIKFDIICSAEVCNPTKGLVIEAEIKNKNALGILAESIIKIDKVDIPILDIIIPKKAAGIMSEIDLDELNIGDSIFVMVLSKKYQLNDKKISIIGKAVKSLDSTINDLIENKIEELNIQKEDDDEEDLSVDVEDSDSEHSEEAGSDVSELIPKKINVDDEEDETEELPDDLDDLDDLEEEDDAGSVVSGGDDW
jgi:DNA-directed RNA polymerase subunit E'/Rpb7